MDNIAFILPLKEYGYFSLIAGMSGPIGTAVQHHSFLKEKMIATQFVAVIGFAGTVALFSTELLYAWTGDMQAAKWAGDILFWEMVYL